MRFSPEYSQKTNPLSITNPTCIIPTKSEIGVMLPSSFDDMDSDDMTIEQIVRGPSEYGRWGNRNLF